MDANQLSLLNFQQYLVLGKFTTIFMIQYLGQIYVETFFSWENFPPSMGDCILYHFTGFIVLPPQGHLAWIFSVLNEYVIK